VLTGTSWANTTIAYGGPGRLDLLSSTASGGGLEPGCQRHR